MGRTTEIGWTDATWNPIWGCTKVSDGCINCYISRSTPFRVNKIRFDGPNGPNAIGATTGVQLFPHRLDQPLRWQKSLKIFVNSLSDLFHDEVDDDFIAEVFAVMHEAPWHVFQVLTKRPARMRALMRSEAFLGKVVARVAEWRGQGRIGEGPVLNWPPPNVWLGVSVESPEVLWRIPILLDTLAAVRFLSCEPLLERLTLSCQQCQGRSGITGHSLAHGEQDASCGMCDGLGVYPVDWVIAGGESGPDDVRRPFELQWARELRDQVVAAEMPFYFKQVGGRSAKAGGRLLDGRTWDELPPMPREFVAA